MYDHHTISRLQNAAQQAGNAVSRREALRSLLIAAGGTLMLPSCFQGDKKVSIPLGNISVSGPQEELLALIVDTIVPPTGTPGAAELGVHQFVLVMIDDCSGTEEQERFLKGFDAIENKAKEVFGKRFDKCSSEERLELLTGAEAGKYDEGLNSFVKQVKAYTVQGYLKSQYVMSNLLKYELVPGRFRGSVPVNEKNGMVQNG